MIHFWQKPARITLALAATDGKNKLHSCLYKGEHLPQEVIDPQNFRPRLAGKPVRLHTEPPCQILCPAEMEITRDDENGRRIHAVLLGKLS